MLAVLLAASVLGCASNSYLTVRRVPRNPLAGPLQLLSHTGPQPTPRTRQVLRRLDLEAIHERDPEGALAKLREIMLRESHPETTYAFAELAYVQGKRSQAKGGQAHAFDLYSASVAHAYLYLFPHEFAASRNYYDPQFRQACDLYNSGLEDLLRIVNKHGRLRPGQTFAIELCGQRFDVGIVTRGLWQPDDFERFEFVSDFEVKGLTNRSVTYGLGVPLIAVRSKQAGHDPATPFYPPGMTTPVTAILQVAVSPSSPPGQPCAVQCPLELHDPLLNDHVQVAQHSVPLETDLTTPLGYFLDRREFRESRLATWGLLDPQAAGQFQGLYMLEAFDPRKIPVLMVHGLWSSPETWTQMINELRSLPELRDRYQFWTYLYPTGQPFWISATQLRADLARVRQTVDPQRRYPHLDRMVLLGHSMGGLVARMQTIESGEEFWTLLSDRPFAELKTDPETRQRLAETLFFHSNPAIRRVVTIGTPHRGSTFANDYTRWLGRKLIKLPAMLVQTQMRLVRENPGFFRNTDLLTIKTSVDSLSPKSPVLSALLAAERAPWVKYDNVVGVIDETAWLSKVSDTGDGVVAYKSAHLDDVASETVVEADHVTIHQHPRTILEVRRILLEHSDEMYAEMHGPPTAIPATYPAPPPRSPPLEEHGMVAPY